MAPKAALHIFPVCGFPRAVLKYSSVRGWDEGVGAPEANSLKKAVACGLPLGRNPVFFHHLPHSHKPANSKWSCLNLFLHSLSHQIKIRKRIYLFPVPDLDHSMDPRCSSWSSSQTSGEEVNIQPFSSPLPTPPIWLTAPPFSHLVDLKGCWERWGLSYPKPPNYSLLNNLSAWLDATKKLSWVTR